MEGERDGVDCVGRRRSEVGGRRSERTLWSSLHRGCMERVVGEMLQGGDRLESVKKTPLAGPLLTGPGNQIN